MKKKKPPSPYQTIRQDCRRIFRDPEPPTTVWEQQFDGMSLNPVITKDWGDLTITDLYEYWDDLAYVKELQPDLFQYLFPICLAMWHEELMQNRFIDPFYLAMHRSKAFEHLMSERQRQSVYDYMCNALMDRIQQERGFVYAHKNTLVYSWIYTFSNLGALLPLTATIWTRWWALDQPGKAVSALKYASGLVYDPRENLLFPPWTPEQGGGPPNLTELDTCFQDGWLPENLQFLRETLSAGYICDKLAQAAAVLQDEPESETATRIASDARQRQNIITIRIEELIDGLQHPEKWLEWND